MQFLQYVIGLVISSVLVLGHLIENDSRPLLHDIASSVQPCFQSLSCFFPLSSSYPLSQLDRMLQGLVLKIGIQNCQILANIMPSGNATNPSFNPWTIFYSPSKVFLVSRYSLSFLRNLQMSKNLHIRWQGIGGRTVSKVVKYEPGVVGSFAPEIVIVQLGSNDLTSMSAANTGSAIEDLARLLF